MPDDLDRSPDGRLRLLVGAVLGLAIVAAATVLRHPTTGDFEFFVERYRQMSEPGGLHLYALRRDTQSGPLALVAVGLIGAVDSGGYWLLPIVLGALCAITLRSLSQLDGARDRDPLVLLLGGLVLVAWWKFLAKFGHIDDALVLTVAAVALRDLQRGRRITSAVLIGLALAVKPWAVFLVPLTLGREGPLGRRLALPMLSTVVGGVIWSPFLLADSGTLAGLRPSVLVAPDSVVRLLLTAGSSVPPGFRIVQLLLGTLVVAWVVHRGHPSCALLAGVAVRLSFDGATWPYFTVGLVLGALMWDLDESRVRLPWATIAVSLLVPPAWFVEAHDLRAAMRLLAAVGSLVLVALTASQASPDRSTTPPEEATGTIGADPVNSGDNRTRNDIVGVSSPL